jgi:serine/threonine-protein kinase
MCPEDNLPMPPAASPHPGDAPAEYLTLTVTAGPHQGRSFSFSGHDTFFVGRSKRAHFQLTSKDKYFSRIHFLVEVNPPCCRVIDMGSHNGTFVNGRRVQMANLRDGDQIQAGHTVLTVALAGKESQAADLPATLSIQAEPPVDARFSQGVADTVPEGFPVIPGYDIVRVLGRGGMGVIYEAVRRADKVQVALKTIVPAIAGSPAQVGRFLREVRILCLLNHRHIVPFREMGESRGLFYFAMDYVEGADVGKMLERQGPLPVWTAVRLLCQVLSALAYAHKGGFVHRDIKPSNILVEEKGSKKNVRLADFGLARVYQSSQLSGLTMQGEIGGTFAFMAPEQATHFREARPAADQYSAGATLYNLLTGQHLANFSRSNRGL